MSRAGHFFCDFCDDVVNLRFVGDFLTRCPVCQHLTAHWLPDEAPEKQRVMTLNGEVVPVPPREVSASVAAGWFARMHQVVEGTHA